VKLPKFAFFEGRIVPYEKAKIGVMTHALNYGTGVFAGVRAYWNSEEEQLFIFRPRDHFKRFTNAWKIINTHLDYSIEDLVDIVRRLLRKEAYREDCYIRPLAYKADEVVGVRVHDLRDALTMFAVPFTRYIERDDGAQVTFSSWRRIDDNAVPARAKLTGAYINSALIKTDAVRSGFDEALVLTDQGHVSEGSAENVFMLRDGELITPPVTENILEGITRRTVMQLAREELGLEVVERQVDRTEIYLCDELFMTGTAAQVTAIVSVDHHPIGDGVMGPVTAKVRALYDDVVRGRIEKYRAWNEAVYVKEVAPAR
jgi:branched-chain amino acid aminotransferase